MNFTIGIMKLMNFMIVIFLLRTYFNLENDGLGEIINLKQTNNTFHKAEETVFKVAVFS